MKNIIISPLTKKIVVRFINKQVDLPEEIQARIDSYWNKLVETKKNYRRGEVFTVTGKREMAEVIEVEVEKTDYAHYLFCQNVEDMAEFGVRIIHTAVLVDTNDEKTVFGRMGDQTSRAGIHQLCGGGLDNGDLRDGFFDLEHNIKKELAEEFGIDADDNIRVKNFSTAYLKEGGPTDKMSVIYRVELDESAEEFRANYSKFADDLRKKGELPEFGDILIMDRNGKELADFLAREDVRIDEYMQPLFEFMNSRHERIKIQ